MKDTDLHKKLGKVLDDLLKILNENPEIVDNLDTVYSEYLNRPRLEYLNQTEHADRLGVARSTIWRRQKESNLYKTELIGAVEHYVWIDGEPVINEIV